MTNLTGRRTGRVPVALAAALVTALVTAVAPAVPVSASTTAVAPVRVLDTRSGVGVAAGRLDPGEIIALRAPGTSGATSVALNLTTDNALGSGFVVAWPCDETMPDTSILNYTPTHPVTNAVMIDNPASGVCFASSAPVHLIADLMAWSTGTGDFAGTRPHRLVDTRSTGNALSAGETRRVRVAGLGGIPATATAAALNITVDRPARDGFVTVFPCGPVPEASNGNFRAGETVANFTLTALAAGDVCIHSSAPIELIVDSFGWTGGGGQLRSLAPQRLLDTRNGTWSTGIAPNGATVELRVAGRGAVPNSAAAALLTLTAVDGRGDGFVTAWPCDRAMPDASVLNLWPGVVRANLTLLSLSAADGEVCLRVTTHDGSPVHLVADVVGYVPGSFQRPAPPAGPTPPPAAGHFATLPPGSPLPSDAECAARVRPAAENRPGNAVPNATRGTSPNDKYPRVTGNFTGTTDQILQWAACKWGIDEDVVRAQIVKESWWNQSNVGDNGESFGLGQVRRPYHQTAFEDENAVRSSAYNVDYTYAGWRSCFEGNETWLNQFERGREYTAGDLWGCVGVWFSGRWYTEAAVAYIEGGDTLGYGNVGVKEHLQRRTWTLPEFAGG
jgi:hypothetical protein